MSETGKPEPISIEYAGKVIAWNKEGTRIIASGAGYEQAREAAEAAGESDPILERVPHRTKRFIKPALYA